MAAIRPSIKNLYRLVVPLSIRNLALVDWIKARFFPHDMIYDDEYYDSIVEGPAARSAGTISDSVVQEFKPTRIVDVGCGTGAMLAAFRERGCEVFGLEYSEAALNYCRRRRLDVMRFNLEQDSIPDGRTFDVAISMEVAEHLPERIADRYVDLLTRLSRIIVFTAAPPGQGGADHVNEQLPSYWIEKFNQRGFDYKAALSDRLRKEWRAAGDVESWYYQNLMIFGQAE